MRKAAFALRNRSNSARSSEFSPPARSARSRRTQFPSVPPPAPGNDAPPAIICTMGLRSE
ncbi:MAG: hypothetical protein OXT07_01720 [bacterium]|nr:hypothetical protein [bacterium]